jgi:hypothetical protein
MVSGDAIVTAAAALGGAIVGGWLTAWVAGRSQEKQARHADKRQVYATCLASFEKMIRPIVAYSATLPGSKSRHEAKSVLDVANDSMFVALGELKLIAPESVRHCAEEIDHFFQKIIDNPPTGGFPAGEPPLDYKDLRHELLMAMRVDLDESAK